MISVRWLRQRAADAVGRPMRSRPVRRLTRRWRRSLQLRVAVTTLVLSSVVVALLGVFLTRQIGQGLLDAKVKAALAEAGGGLSSAQSQLQSDLTTTAPADPGVVDQELGDIAKSLNDRGSPAGLYGIVLLSTSGTESGYVSAGLDQTDIPGELQRTVARTGQEAYTFARVPSGSGSAESLVVGGPLYASDQYELYYLFPLAPEADTLRLVERILAFGGAVLVILLVALTALVTRQVVSPVRLAARAAGRLSAGRLAERMAVKGEDDLARLAVSFNSMAGNLQGKIRELEDLSRVQRRFVSDVSHELRTPLTTVRMAADVLHAARADFAPALARSAELLTDEVDRFETLLADLLEISRFDAQAAVCDVESTDLTELVRQVIAAATPLAQRSGSQFDLSGVPAGLVVAEVDPRRVARVVRNLVSNAIKYGEGRPITVRVAADADAAAVSVRDHGIGLRPGEGALAFNRFWRADPSRARHTGGTGLGLAIALEDTRLHGGWLQAWGQPGQGAVFRATFPRQAGDTLLASPLPLDPGEPAAAPRPGPVPAGYR